MRPRWAVPAASVLVVLAVGMVPATVVLGAAGVAEDAAELAWVVVFVGAFAIGAGVGAVLAVKRPGNSLGWLLLVAGVGMNTSMVASGYGMYAVDLGLGALPYAGYVRAILGVAWAPAAVAGLVLVPLTFPTGRPPTPRWRWIGWLGVAAGGVLVFTMFWATARHGDLVGQHWDVFEAALEGTLLWRVSNLAWPALLIAGVLAWVSLVLRFVRSRGEERQQLKWFVLAAAVTIAYIVVVNYVLIDPFSWVTVVAGAVALPSVSFAIGIAVLRYRLYEIDRIISRTVSYGVLTALLAGVYLGVVLLLAPLLGRGSDLTVAGATLAAAAAFGPLRRRVQAVVDRRFNRTSYHAEQAVAGFRDRLRSAVDLDALTQDLLRTVDSTLEPVAATVWLRQEAVQ